MRARGRYFLGWNPGNPMRSAGVDPPPERESAFDPLARRWTRPEPRTGRPQGRRANVRWDDQPLGLVPDGKLAFQLGVSRSSVGIARRRRGIPPFGRWPLARFELDEIILEVEALEAAPQLSLDHFLHVTEPVRTGAGLTMLWPDACDPRSESAYDQARSGVFPIAQRPEGDPWTTCRT